MADEEYFDDAETTDEEDFEEFDEDFEAAGATETKVKCVSGMDTFAVVWSFFATLIALCILSWAIVYEVYDERLGEILPEKEKPIEQSKISVLSFGRDPAISDSYNYAIIKAGRAATVTPGTIIFIGDPEISPPKTPDEAWVVLVVTEECEANISKAMIVAVYPPAMGRVAGTDGQEISVGPSGEGASDRGAEDWSQIDNLTEAIEKLPLLLDLSAGEEPGKSDTKAATATWRHQVLIRTIEERFGNHKRREPKKKK